MQKTRYQRFYIYEVAQRCFLLEEIMLANMMKKQFLIDNKFVFQKKFWKVLYDKKIELFCDEKRIKYKLQSSHEINKNNEISLDLSSWRRINKIEHKKNSFLQPIDKGRNDNFYFSLMQELKVNHRIKRLKSWLNTIRRRCSKSTADRMIPNVHYIFLTEE
jgi:hypothetical protein